MRKITETPYNIIDNTLDRSYLPFPKLEPKYRGHDGCNNFEHDYNHNYYREVQLNFTPEIEVFLMSLRDVVLNIERDLSNSM